MVEHVWGSPWIFDKIKLELSGNDWVGPDKVELASVMLEHYDLLVSLVGKDRAIRQHHENWEHFTVKVLLAPGVFEIN